MKLLEVTCVIFFLLAVSFVIGYEECTQISNPSQESCFQDCFCGFCTRTEMVDVIGRGDNDVGASDMNWNGNNMSNGGRDGNVSYLAELEIPVCCFGDATGPSEGCGCSNESWVWNHEMAHRDKICWSQIYLIDAFFGLLAGCVVIIVSVVMIYLAEVYWVERKRKPFVSL